MRIIAHRGASAEAPENTLAAFGRAIETGAGMIELDVHLTSDGIPVVIHDPSLDRTTDGEGAVGDLPLEEIRRFSAGGWFAEEFRRERVPTLAEVYDLVAGRAEINVEIKGEAPSTAAAALNVVSGLGALDRSVFSSFNPHALERIRAASGQARIALLTDPTSLADVRRVPSDDPAGRILARVAHWSRLGLEGANLHRILASAAVVEALHGRGLLVYVYTVDGLSAAEAMARMGVDGIFANDPAPLLTRFPS